MPHNTEIETVFDEILRVDDLQGDGRTLTGYAVPWNKPTYVARPMQGYESYKRGALSRSWEERGSTEIPLMAQHSEDAIGKLVDTRDDEYGQHVVFRVFDTTAARDAMEMVKEGIWKGLSIGGYPVPARTKVTRGVDGERFIERSEIRWDHTALVRKPAFEDARVLTLREMDALGVDIDPVALAQARKRRRELALW